MRYFITGCTGFIGIHLCRFLLSQDNEVFGLVRNPEKIPEDLKPKLKVVHGDLSIFKKDNLVLPDVDVIIHLAGVVSGKNPSQYNEINYQSVKDLLSTISRQNFLPKKFIFASSQAAMGPNLHNIISKETDQALPIDPYGIAKLNSEKLVQSQHFPTTVFRPSLVLGPGDPATLTLFKIAKSGVAFLPAGKARPMSFVYIDDLVRAIVLMSKNHKNTHDLYFITSESPISNHMLMQEIGKSLDQKLYILKIPKFILRFAVLLSTAYSSILGKANQFDHKQYKQMIAPSFLCTSLKFTNETKWKAKVSFSDAIRISLDGYRTLKWL